MSSKLAGDAIDEVLHQLRSGEVAVEEARRRLDALATHSLGFATVDHDRHRRCGAAEVIYAAGKTPEQVVAIARVIREREPAVLITRTDAAHREALAQAFPGPGPGIPGEPMEVAEACGAVLVGVPVSLDVEPIPVVTAGTSDLPVAEEARLTCLALGHPVTAINDVGVAGLHRLTPKLATLRRANVIVCIAGMEGALSSVLGGLVDVPVIAVPTSVGYGAAFGGIAALLGMLTSCASGVTVVNIDNGFGAAYAACQINRIASRHDSPQRHRGTENGS